MLLINFKNYITGKKALKLARKIQKYLPKAIVCLSDLEIETISQQTDLKVYAQHVDYFKTDRATGFSTPENIKQAGAVGSLLNHAEHRLMPETIEKTVKRAKQAGLKIVLCTDSVKQARNFIKLYPDAIAFEDKKLIATKKSITQYKPNQIKKFVSLLKKTKILPLCGAGIHSAEDVASAYKLGCKGVLIASAIANNKKPMGLLKELAKIKF
ncbi:MAG: triose-phosphate isomerase [Nanoarchaeota archaeon]|nr:triose-phosphate isomerase [Nanoarchaeota archaeon]MBU1051216.1 triose-phosphate isomerase [Nanoarchaeota archaeon]MBU1988061.1 triose-phosphate isomerase [Nanoarchaeota archaeon]